MELLIQHKMSKYRLERESGLTHSAIIQIFNGSNKDVKLSTVKKVARAFKMTLGDFMSVPVFDRDDLEFE